MPAMQNATDALTENGILTDHPDITMAELKDIHGEPRQQTDETVLFADKHGHAFDEWADAFDVSYSSFSQRMHDIARSFDPNDGIDRWGALHPLAFDARTFDETDGTATESAQQISGGGE